MALWFRVNGSGLRVLGLRFRGLGGSGGVGALRGLGLEVLQNPTPQTVGSE